LFSSIGLDLDPQGLGLSLELLSRGLFGLRLNTATWPRSLSWIIVFDPFNQSLILLPRDSSAERGNATVSRLSVTFRYQQRLEFFENNFTTE